MELDYKAIGKRIKNLRCNKMHMSQVAFADEINVSKQTLYKYENNIITNIPSDKIEIIGKVLEVSPSYLMGWEDNLENAPDILPDLMSDSELLDNLKMLMKLSKEHRQTIFDNITYWHEKEGH